MTNEALIASLREYAEWAEANIWEVPINLPDVLNRAAEVIEAATNPMGIEELGLSVRAYNGLYRWNLRLVREVAGSATWPEWDVDSEFRGAREASAQERDGR